MTHVETFRGHSEQPTARLCRRHGLIVAPRAARRDARPTVRPTPTTQYQVYATQHSDPRVVSIEQAQTERKYHTSLVYQMPPSTPNTFFKKKRIQIKFFIHSLLFFKKINVISLLQVERHVQSLHVVWIETFRAESATTTVEHDVNLISLPKEPIQHTYIYIYACKQRHNDHTHACISTNKASTIAHCQSSQRTQLSVDVAKQIEQQWQCNVKQRHWQ